MLFQDHIDFIATQPSKEPYTGYLKNIATLQQIFHVQQKAQPRTRKPFAHGARNMPECFTDGQRIRHKKSSLATEWVGTYNKASNTISCKGKSYRSMGHFTLAHYKEENSTRTTVDGWQECECELEPDKWVSTYKLKAL